MTHQLMVAHGANEQLVPAMRMGSGQLSFASPAVGAVVGRQVVPPSSSQTTATAAASSGCRT